MKATKLFITGGKATFTVKNNKGDHYTFRVVGKEARQGGMIYFVNLLTGNDNENDYTYMGLLNVNAGRVNLTAKSRYNADTLPVKVFNWAIPMVFEGRDLPEGYACDTDNRCGRCGRELTHPDGVNNEGYRFGFGATCWKAMGN